MHEVILPSTQLAVLAIGLLSPMVGYILNYLGPWANEKVKAVIHVIVAAVAAGLYQAVEVGGFGANNTTLQLVITSILAAFAAHHWFYKPSTISNSLGGGQNKPKT